MHSFTAKFKSMQKQQIISIFINTVTLFLFFIKMNNVNEPQEGPRPYAFEPRRLNRQGGGRNVEERAQERVVHDMSPSESSESDSDYEWDGVDVETEGWRLDSMIWCTCGNCQHLAKVRENLCCKEIEHIREMATGQCITEHGDFDVLCLHPEVLRTALIARFDIRRNDLREPIQNEYEHIVLNLLKGRGGGGVHAVDPHSDLKKY